jgi:hypothetical protein
MSELSLLLISQGTAAGIIPPGFLGSFAFAIIATSFISAWLIERENEIYNALNSAVPQLIVNNLRVLRSTVMGMRRAVSESSRYYRVVEMLPSISYPSHPEQLSVREQLVLTTKNSMILVFASLSCFAGLYFAQSPDWAFLDSLFVFIFTGFLLSSLAFIINVDSAMRNALKLMLRSSNGPKYAAVAHFVSAVIFISLGALYYWSYSLAPASLSFLLCLPAFILGARSAYKTVRAISLKGSHL